MNNNLVDICVNLTDKVFSGKEDAIINEANKKKCHQNGIGWQ